MRVGIQMPDEQFFTVFPIPKKIYELGLDKVLTKQELRILCLMRDFISQQDLTRILKIKATTLKGHKKKLLAKIGCKNSHEAYKMFYVSEISDAEKIRMINEK